MPKPNAKFTVAQMKAYIRTHKLNIPKVKLGMKRAEMIVALKSLGHWDSENDSEMDKLKLRVKFMERQVEETYQAALKIGGYGHGEQLRSNLLRHKSHPFHGEFNTRTRKLRHAREAVANAIFEKTPAGKIKVAAEAADDKRLGDIRKLENLVDDARRLGVQWRASLRKAIKAKDDAKISRITLKVKAAEAEIKKRVERLKLEKKKKK
jgi:hypothetical protein